MPYDVTDLGIISSGDSLLPVWHQAINQTNCDMMPFRPQEKISVTIQSIYNNLR